MKPEKHVTFKSFSDADFFQWISGRKLCFRRFELAVRFSLLSVCVGKLGQRKLLGAANDLINWLWWLMTYILLRVSLSFEREIDAPRSASRCPRLPLSIPPSIPPCSLPGLSAESGWSAGRDPKYLAPPRLPRGTLGGGTEGEADLNRLKRHTSENIFQERRK